MLGGGSSGGVSTSGLNRGDGTDSEHDHSSSSDDDESSSSDDSRDEL